MRREFCFVSSVFLLVSIFGFASVADAKIPVSVTYSPGRTAFKTRYSSSTNKFRMIFDEIMTHESRVMQGQSRVHFLAASANLIVPIRFSKLTRDFVLEPRNFIQIQGASSGTIQGNSAIGDQVVKYDMMKEFSVFTQSCDNNYTAEVKVDGPKSNQMDVSILAHTFDCIFKDSLVKVRIEKVSSTKSKLVLNGVFGVKGTTVRKATKYLPKFLVHGEFRNKAKGEVRKILETMRSLAAQLN